MKTIPPTIRTLYADLAQELHARSERPGSVYIRAIKGIDYAYAKRSVGVTRRDVFLGRADDPETVARVEAIKAEGERAKARRKTISALKAGGVPAPAPQLGAVLDALDDAGLLPNKPSGDTHDDKIHSEPGHRTQRRARRNPEQARIGKRIAQITLHRRAACAQPRPDHDGQQGTRQAQFGKNDRSIRRAGRIEPDPPRQQRKRKRNDEQPAEDQSRAVHDTVLRISASRRAARMIVGPPQ